MVKPFGSCCRSFWLSLLVVFARRSFLLDPLSYEDEIYRRPLRPGSQAALHYIGNETTTLRDLLFDKDSGVSEVYKGRNWDGAPIVVEEYKLVFFTQPKIASTEFKKLLRRMMHLNDWRVHKEPNLPHNPARNGLVYLYHYSPEEAYHRLTDPQWTRAIFVRDPGERILSAYLDKGARKDGTYLARHCKLAKDDPLVLKASSSLEGFIEVVRDHCCCDPHWKSQSQRMSPKLWSYVNFVGHFDSLASDTGRLLKRLDAWEFGASGWGPSGNMSIFEGSTSAKHRTNSRAKVQEYFNSKEIESKVAEFYATDYANPLFGFSSHQEST